MDFSEKLGKIEALFTGAKTEGERQAAEAAKQLFDLKLLV